MPSPLASPFNAFFRDRADADWAFNLLRQTLTALGVDDPADERFVLTLSEEENALRLNFGKWNVLGFKAGAKEPLVEMALFQGETDVKQIKEAATYAYRNSDPEVAMHQDIPLTTVQKWPGNLRLVFEDTLAFVANRFGNWKRSNFRNAHLPALADAVFDPEKRTHLLTGGVSETELLFDDEDLSTNGEPPRAGYFTPQTFALLDGLRADPTKAFYQGQRDEFRTYLEIPFKTLLADVAAQLPWDMKTVLETQTRVISRILKNDFGRGGAWDFYWGAFYPKGSSRQEDAQLSIWINWERLEVGFYIGDEGQAVRERFIRNCQTYRETLLAWLPVTLPEELVYGKPGKKKQVKLAEFLDDPAKHSFDVSLILPTDEILQLPPPALTQRIADTFTRLFPFFLLAVQDDPLPALETHLKPNSPQILPVPTSSPSFPLPAVAHATGFDEPSLAGFLRALERRKQAILYGPPGTGKTHLAEHLARHLIGGTDGFTELVQFHPSYAYEDFVIGLRPVANSPQFPQFSQVPTSSHSSPELLGTHRNSTELPPTPLPPLSSSPFPLFSLVPGRFLDFCTRARTRTGPCVLIIDEINRADLSRVFGELMVLLEYRDREITLASGQPFSIPGNVRLLGTMNTADRSIALVDFALRRRFAFLAVPPNFDALRRYHTEHAPAFPVENLIALLERINAAIADPNFALGQSFFLRPALETELEDIWRTEIEPYLEEYFFDQPEMVEAFRWERVGGMVNR